MEDKDNGYSIPTAEEVQSWAQYFEAKRPILTILKEMGLSTGEAVLLLEINNLSGQILDLTALLAQDVSEGEDWRREQDGE